MWTLPQWDSLVTKHMASHNTSMWHAVALLLAFGALLCGMMALLVCIMQIGLSVITQISCC